MAKLSAHGAELYRIEHVTYRVARMSDGKILRDNGGGWKLWKKLKPGFDPVEQARKAREFHENVTADRVWRSDYRRKMVGEFPCLEKRIMASTAIELMPDDADGVWATLDDEGTGTDLDTVVELCDLYKRAMAEGKAAKEAAELKVQPQLALA